MTSLQLIAKDHIYLESLLHAQQRDTDFSQLLRRKLETAEVVLPEMLDPQTSTIDSEIAFSVGGGSSEQRVLTRHEKATGPGLPLPVTTLRGLALLGLRAGDIFALKTPGGIIEPLRLEKVRHPAQWGLRRQDRDTSVVAFPPLSATVRGPASSPPDDDDPGPRAA
jgi:regulator of nucleoside diphosphate kinase